MEPVTGRTALSTKGWEFRAASLRWVAFRALAPRRQSTMNRSSCVWRLCIGTISLSALGLTTAACSSVDDQESVGIGQEALIGDALPGTNATDFAAARAAFNTSENAADGLGPI